MLSCINSGTTVSVQCKDGLSVAAQSSAHRDDAALQLSPNRDPMHPLLLPPAPQLVSRHPLSRVSLSMMVLRSSALPLDCRLLTADSTSPREKPIWGEERGGVQGTGRWAKALSPLQWRQGG